MAENRSRRRHDASRCPECGRPASPASPGVLFVPTALVLAGGLLSHYIVGLALIAVGLVLAVRREHCRCGAATASRSGF